MPQSKTPFNKMKRERIRSLRRETYKHTYGIYSDYKKPITLAQSITLTEQFFDFLAKKHKPNARNVIGAIYIGKDGAFSIQPRFWRDTDHFIDELNSMLNRYKSRIRITFIIGWIELPK